MNIDATEVQKFDALAPRWWDKNGPCGPLHHLNPLRLSFIQQQVSLAGKKVLDVGCGGGILTEACAKAGATATGIDASSAAIEAARQHLQASQLVIEYQTALIEDFSKEHAGQFDVITCMELLEHVPSPAAVVTHCAKLLKKGGHLFFSTINRNAKAFCLAILGAEYLLRLLPRGTHTYAQFIRPSELMHWCLEARLEPKTMMGMTYNPLTQQYSLTKNCDVNYLFYAALVPSPIPMGEG